MALGDDLKQISQSRLEPLTAPSDVTSLTYLVL